jgi:hypothetical protein
MASAPRAPAPAGDVARRQPELLPAPEEAGGTPVARTDDPGEEGPRERLSVPPVVIADSPREPVASNNTPGSPPPDPPAALTVPLDGMEMFRPSVARVTLPPLLEVHQLQAEQVTPLLAKGTAFRIELPCPDTARGFRRLEAALKAHGTTLIIDREAQFRLTRPRLKSNFAIFVEDISPEELARALVQVGSDDRKAAAAKPQPDALFSKMFVEPMSETDRKDLRDLFRHDIRPVTTPPRPSATVRPPVRGQERLALGVTYNPVRPAPGSVEVKRFFDSRKPIRPRTVQVLIVLRETQG